MTDYQDKSVFKPTLHYSELWKHGQFREFKHPLVSVSPSILIKNQKALIAQSFIPADTIIYTYGAQASLERTRTSVQVSMEHHLEAGDFASYTNHSCSPNSVLKTSYSPIDNTGKVALITIRNINKGEELTFDYATTETELTPDLKNSQCLCNSPQCRKRMVSFTELKETEKNKLYENGLLSDHIINHYFLNK